MTLDQGLAFAVLGGMMVLFISGRLRYDLVAAVALAASVLVGIVPHDKAFSGFSDDIVVIVASALVVSAAVARSGVIQRLLQRVSPYLTSVQLQVVVLVGAVTILCAFVKNIGALAMLIPVAFQLARKSGASPSVFLMPMAFGSLLGGLITLVGTSPNIIVARMRWVSASRRLASHSSPSGIAFCPSVERLLPQWTKPSRSRMPLPPRSTRPRQKC